MLRRDGSARELVLEPLARAVAARRAVLFVGAGVSMGLGLPAWSELVAHMAKELGLEPETVGRPGANYLTIAEYYKIEKGIIGSLRSWMQREWDVPVERLLQSRVHNLIVDLDFPFIYTTNYDRNIERIYEARQRPFSKIVNVRDIATGDPAATQIVKFHGDFDDDSSIVLTETDFFNRLDFDSPLDIRFRADVLGRTILFVGYSLTDLNLRLMLYKMQQMWKRSGFEGQRPPSYLFMTSPDPVQQRVLHNWGIETVTSEVQPGEEALVDLFASLKATAAAIAKAKA